MEYLDKNTGLIMYSSWWKKGKDFLKTHAIITRYGDRIEILKQKIQLLQNGWKEILPVTLKFKCECHKENTFEEMASSYRCCDNGDLDEKHNCLKRKGNI